MRYVFASFICALFQEQNYELAFKAASAATLSIWTSFCWASARPWTRVDPITFWRTSLFQWVSTGLDSTLCDKTPVLAMCCRAFSLSPVYFDGVSTISTKSVLTDAPTTSSPFSSESPFCCTNFFIRDVFSHNSDTLHYPRAYTPTRTRTTHTHTQTQTLEQP